jgi:hypothetical protein
VGFDFTELNPIPEQRLVGRQTIEIKMSAVAHPLKHLFQLPMRIKTWLL